MKAFYIIVVTVGVFCLGLIGVSQAAFQEIGTGARPTAMAGSFVPVADDANAIFLNPSGLAGLTRPEITTMYARLFPGIEGDNLAQGLVGYVHPLGALGAIGLGWQSMMSNLFDENTITFSYARKAFKTLALGVNLKFLRWDADLEPGDPLGDTLSKTTFGVDAGILWSATYNLTVGAAVRNVNQPNIAHDPSLGGDLPMEIHVGLGYRLSFTLISAEFVDVDGKRRLLVGAERVFPTAGVYLRGGGNWNSLEKKSEWGQASLGLGYEFKGLRLDYSWVYFSQIPDTEGAHRFSIGYKF